MPRPKKDNHAMTIRLATPIYDRLTKFCAVSGQPKTVAIERALEMYIDDYDEKQKQLQIISKGTLVKGASLSTFELITETIEEE